MKKLLKLKKIVILTLLVSMIGSIKIVDVNAKATTSKTQNFKITHKKKIKVKTVLATKKEIIIKITNNKKKQFVFCGAFNLEKRVKNKWNTVKNSENILFAKSTFIAPQSSILIKVKWKDFFGHNLSKGKYKINFMNEYLQNKIFKIKNENVKYVNIYIKQTNK